MHHPSPAVSRRVVIGAGLATASWLAACAPGPGPDSTSTVSAPAPEPSPTSGPTATPVPTRAELDRTALSEKYAGRVPKEWGLDVTGVPGRTEADGVLLTLDLCGGPGGAALDQRLIDLLVEHEVPAGVFVNARWIDANPGAVERLVDTGLIDMANHGTSHRPLSVNGRAAYGINGTKDVGAAIDEVLGCHEKLTAITGRAPRWFRSGTAHYDEVAVEIVRELGEIPVGFSVNGDAGATLSSGQVAAALRTVTKGDIVIAHANRPDGATAEGFAAALPQLLATGTRFIRLADAELI
ncbi:polysaccharide deacetylase family protein [Granulicoccus sp. GXG6511]|uniref:polysaccharide deacetylase family protein n=1 Tax=Granulicoccus sp. GXG6511 TaxID=3381351 RepID=UPI003D7CD34B